MPRKIELTWQPGTGARQGRWKKKYRGKAYYFPFGNSKSDREGYLLALESWKQKKAELDEADEAAPKLNQAEYRVAIEEWTLALQWAREAGHDDQADRAGQIIAELSAKLARRSLPPLDHSDKLLSGYSVPPHILDRYKQYLPATDQSDNLKLEVPRDIIDSWDGSRQRISREIWADRIDTQRRKSLIAADTVASSIDGFLVWKRSQAEAKEISAGRYSALKVHLEYFRTWVGGGASLSIIDSKLLSQYHSDLLRHVTAGKWAADYVKDWLAAAKSYIRWLWRTERLDQLPRILECSDLKISKKLVEPRVFTTEEIRTLLQAATDRTRLYLLLMLNCAMTQKDISDLRQSEVDLKAERIVRKRSKTSKHDAVPTVSYRLWQETLVLLRQERSTDSVRFLVNDAGRPLKTEDIGEDGRFCKTDNIASAYKRLQKFAGVRKSLKVFRKTSATLVRSHENFSGMYVLFLGLTPGSIADRHYAQTPQVMLDNAVLWLGGQYGMQS